MNKYFLVILLILMTAANIFAQKNFLLKNASKTFDVKISVAKCEDDVCEGKGTIYLMKKGQTAAFQTIAMPNIYLELGANKKPTANLVELYGENNSGVIFDDYNFDGAEDLAIRNGNSGAYGGPSYDIFLMTKGTGKFVENADLSGLASENLGLFDVDKKAKTLETFTKDGCCWHQTTRYKIVNNRPVKIYVFTEDAKGGDDKVRLTTETLIDGKWKKTTKTALTKDYYKEQ